MLSSQKPVISVCAVRTGCGKSQTSRKIVQILNEKGRKVAAIRHPMPYGDLEQQRIQRFAELADLDRHQCTIEEREEYEPYIEEGASVYAGVDYQAILEEAEKEADIILWDGGNNDYPFYHSDLEITMVDPHRPGHELEYYPGMVNFLRSQVIIINKIDSAAPEKTSLVEENIRRYNPQAQVIRARSTLTVEEGDSIAGKRVLVVEDGPTTTHGGMPYGAGYLVAQQKGAAEIVDPRPYAVGSIKNTFDQFPHLDSILPAMGYGKKQTQELEETIGKAECDLVISGTPIRLDRIINVDKKILHVHYNLEEVGSPTLEELLAKF